MISLQTDVANLILQRTLTESVGGLNNAINRMTSGYKINQAKDNASNHSIITDLSTKISSMLQIQQNSADGVDLLRTAQGGLEEIQNLLTRLRDLATQASNDTYDSTLRGAMQEEADAIIEQIEQIKANTEYNGMNLCSVPKNDTGVVASAVSRLAKSAVVNTNKNNTIISDTSDTFTSRIISTSQQQQNSVDNGIMLLSAGEPVAQSTFLEGSIEFTGYLTKTVTIDEVDYEITNNTASTQSISYSKDTSTGQITFTGSNFKIVGQDGVSHNIVVNGSSNELYGGNQDDILADTSTDAYNSFYGGAGNDVINLSGSHYQGVYGDSGNDTFNFNNYSGNPQNKIIYGGDGDDTFNLMTGSSDTGFSIYGGAGKDTFVVTSSNNTLFGEGDEDIFIINSGINNIVDGGEGTNSLTDNGTKTTKINVPGGDSFSVSFSANETKTIRINNIDYTVTNAKTFAQNFVYSINSSTGAITFNSANFTIYGDLNQSHNVILNKAGIIFYGGNKNDTIVSTMNSNQIYSRGGDDDITITKFTNVYAGEGNDSITFSGYNNFILGEEGDDTITGTSSSNNNRNYINAGEDNDVINVSDAYNVIIGGEGENEFTGSTNNGMSFGIDISSPNVQSVDLAGNETKTITINGIEYEIINQTNNATTLIYEYNSSTDQISFGGYKVKINGQVDKNHDVIIYGKEVTFCGGDLDDKITNYGYASKIYAQGGNDHLINNGGDSPLYGGAGNDTIITHISTTVYAGEGDDIITSNGGNSIAYIIDGQGGNDTYYVNTSSIIKDSGGGNNVYYITKDNNKNINGGSGNDTFYIQADGVKVLGNAGDDYFVVDGNNAEVDGGSGNNYYLDNGTGSTLSNVSHDPTQGTLVFNLLDEVKTFTLDGKMYTVTNKLSSANSVEYSINPVTGEIIFSGSNVQLDTTSAQKLLISVRGDNNIINGSNLDDSIVIDSGSNNTVNANNGNDTIVVNSENNAINGGVGNDSITLNASSNKEINAGSGNDTVNVNSNNNTNIKLLDGNNTLAVNGTNNTISAATGNNKITLQKDSNTVQVGNGENNFILSSDDNIIVAGSGNNKFSISGDGNTVTAQKAVGDITISGNGNTMNLTRGDNDVRIVGDSNTFTSTIGQKNINVIGNTNNVTTGAEDDEITVIGNGNIVESLGGENEIRLEGDTNSYQGGSEVDNVTIKGNSNVAKGGDANDTFMVVDGSGNEIDGEGGERNTIIDNGATTTFTNAVDITPRPFEVKIKVDIGGGDDAYITSSISFNLFDFDVDFSTSKSAAESLVKIDDMLKIVEKQLLNIGTTINKVELAMEAQVIKLNNMISSRSTLRDADIAEESSTFVKFQILSQAATTLMSVSRNIKAESVLALLEPLQRVKG